MTREEAKGIIQGKLNCMNKCDTFKCKCTDECDNCEYCYSQGNFGEQKKAFEIAIESLVTDTNVGGKWIPIGQYPAEPSLLCFKSGNMTVGYYDYEYEGWSVLTADGFETDMTDEDMEDGEPIAYMPLPEPYKEE